MDPVDEWTRQAINHIAREEHRQIMASIELAESPTKGLTAYYYDPETKALRSDPKGGLYRRGDVEKLIDSISGVSNEWEEVARHNKESIDAVDEAIDGYALSSELREETIMRVFGEHSAYEKKLREMARAMGEVKSILNRALDIKSADTGVEGELIQFIRKRVKEGHHWPWPDSHGQKEWSVPSNERLTDQFFETLLACSHHVVRYAQEHGLTARDVKNSPGVLKTAVREFLTGGLAEPSPPAGLKKTMD